MKFAMSDSDYSLQAKIGHVQVRGHGIRQRGAWHWTERGMALDGEGHGIGRRGVWHWTERDVALDREGVALDRE